MAVFLISSSLCSPESDSESAELSSNESGEGNPVDNEFDDQKLQTLNTDELEIIFARLDLDQLAHMAAVDERFANIAKKELAKRCPDYRLEIIWSHVGSASKFTSSNSLKRLSVYEYKLGLKLLKYFGELFPVLAIHNNNFEAERSIVINRYANKYVSEFVTQFKLDIVEGTLEQYTNAFKGVQELDCIIKAENIDDTVLPWNELFPNLQKLSLEIDVTLELNGNYSFADCELPQLEALVISYNDTGKRNKQIEGLIRKNPQIRDLELKFCQRDYIKVINQLLPNLETIILHKLNLNEALHFEKVQRFVLKTNNPRGIENLSFSNLESIRIHYSPRLFDNWLAFFKKHPNLFRLHLQEHTSSNQSVQLEELTSVLPNLVEVTMQYSNYISREDIAKFIETHDKLMKFRFFVRSYKAPDFDTLRDRFGDEWEITRSHASWPGLLFIRKVDTNE